MSEFEPIFGFTSYKINKGGVILGKKGFPLKYNPNVDGYPVVNINNDMGKNRCMRIHRLMALQYIPNPNNLPIVNHKDGNKTNFKLDNLEWVTIQENVTHAIEVIKVDKKCNTDLTREVVELICKDLEDGKKPKEIYQKYNVTLSIVSKIKRGVVWSDVSYKYNLNTRTSRLPVSVVLNIVKYLNLGFGNTEVVKILNHSEVDMYVVSKISNNNTYVEFTHNILKSKEERSQTRANARSPKQGEMVGSH